MKIKDIALEHKGHQLVLRNARAEDAAILIDFLRTTCSETRYLLRESEEIVFTIEQEQNFIRMMNDAENSIMLLAFLDGEFVGNCSLNGHQPKRCRHKADLGIALYQKYTGMGIGTRMVSELINVAKEMNIEQIELEVVTENHGAIALYKKLGFEIYGTHPHDMKYKDGTYADVYWMMRKV